MTLTRHIRVCVSVRYDEAAGVWWAQCPVAGCYWSAERADRDAALDAAHTHEAENGVWP